MSLWGRGRFEPVRAATSRRLYAGGACRARNLSPGPAGRAGRGNLWSRPAGVNPAARMSRYEPLRAATSRDEPPALCRRGAQGAQGALPIFAPGGGKPRRSYEPRRAATSRDEPRRAAGFTPAGPPDPPWGRKARTSSPSLPRPERPQHLAAHTLVWGPCQFSGCRAFP